MSLEGGEKLDVVGEYDFAVDENEGVVRCERGLWENV